ncbi:MAG: hypothetical protein AB2L21_08980 [Anaerolineaceae bacterium]|jgi:DNA-binding NarL/FixJ family response regulator
MAKDILVTIMGDDVFARNWMSLLLVRDWRTRVVSEITLQDGHLVSQETPTTKLDVLLVDLDSFNDNPGIFSIIDGLEADHLFKVLCIGTRIEPKVFTRLKPELFSGYILKDEISFSLGWAITFADEGKVIFTPQTFEAAYRMNYDLPKNRMVIRGRTFPGLTDRQEEIARLAIIFSIGRRDLADELKISDQWSYGMVSELYTKLGLGDMFDGDVDPYDYVGDDPVIRSHIDEILDELGDSKKARDLETFVFHLLTMPFIEEIV